MHALLTAGNTGSCSRHVYKFLNISDASAYSSSVVVGNALRGTVLQLGELLLDYREALPYKGDALLCSGLLVVRLNRPSSHTD